MAQDLLRNDGPRPTTGKAKKNQRLFRHSPATSYCCRFVNCIRDEAYDTGSEVQTHYPIWDTP